MARKVEAKKEKKKGKRRIRGEAGIEGEGKEAGPVPRPRNRNDDDLSRGNYRKFEGRNSVGRERAANLAARSWR